MVIIASLNISVEFAESLVMELIIAGKVEVMTEIEMIDGIILTETEIAVVEKMMMEKEGDQLLNN